MDQAPTQTNLSQQNQETIDEDLLTAVVVSPDPSDTYSIFSVIDSGENSQMTTPPLQTPSPQL